jgi:hypothetical protein
MTIEELQMFDQMSVNPQAWTIEEREYAEAKRKSPPLDFQLMKEFERLVTERVKLRELLGAMVYHQSRMLDKWADGDENVKNDLWKNLHSCGSECFDHLDKLDKTNREL